MERKCEFCDEVNGEMFLHAKCHIAAPLEVSVVDGWLIIRCYLPDCGKEVARFKLANEEAKDGR